MQEFRRKKTMGHALRRCSCKIDIKRKRFDKKKMQFSGLLFFLSILQAGASAFVAVWLPGSVSLTGYFILKAISIQCR